MKKGFTILELLVASVLLGMLMTILTMVFTQSSVSWRLGTSLVADMDDVRDNMAEIREEADNAFAWGGEVRRVVSPWDRDGNLRKRACDAPGSGVDAEDGGKWSAVVLRNERSGALATAGQRQLWSSANLISVGQTAAPDTFDTYTVNVMSGGPNNDVMDWQAIWSYPDDFD